MWGFISTLRFAARRPPPQPVQERHRPGTPGPAAQGVFSRSPFPGTYRSARLDRRADERGWSIFVRPWRCWLVAVDLLG